MVVIIDYNMGNIGSVQNMLRKIGHKSSITNHPDEIENASKLILPGVGAFDSGMEELQSMGLDLLIRKKVLEDKTPLLGICLGAQLLLQYSEEGSKPGLSIIEGESVRFNFSSAEKNLPIPHMGWNEILSLKASKLNAILPPEPRFYFVHSFHFKMKNKEDELFEAKYGYPFCAGFEHENIAGVQFHPEKSHKYGMALLQNFVEKF